MEKKAAHPKYYPEAKVTCACGNTFTTGSTRPELKVEICHQCHPFFTGQEKLIDTEGRVEKFERKRKTAVKKQEEKQKKSKAEKKKEQQRPKTLRELLEKE